MAQVLRRPKCTVCGVWANYDHDTMNLTCGCDGVLVTWEAFRAGVVPAMWRIPDRVPLPPANTDKCSKCGKDLETVGLNHTYPPKRDDMGRAICPHCGHVQGSTAGGNVHSPAMRGSTVVRPADLRWPIQYSKDINPGGYDAD